MLTERERQKALGTNPKVIRACEKVFAFTDPIFSEAKSERFTVAVSEFQEAVAGAVQGVVNHRLRRKAARRG